MSSAAQIPHQGALRLQVQHPGRVDERGNQQDWLAFTAIIEDPHAAEGERDWPRADAPPVRVLLIGAHSGQQRLTPLTRE